MIWVAFVAGMIIGGCFEHSSMFNRLNKDIVIEQGQVMTIHPNGHRVISEQWIEEGED